MVTMQDRPGKGHFYSDDGKTWYESVTAILKSYPKGPKFYEWVAKNGYDAERIKEAAGNVGTRVHHAIERMVSSGESPDTIAADEKFGPSEHIALVGVNGWIQSTRPRILAQELPVISHSLQVGGTVDMVAEIEGGIVVIDFKTSRYIGPTFWLQLHAYTYCLAEMGLFNARRLMVLHLNGIYESSFKEFRRPYRQSVLEQFKALAVTHRNFARNDRTRNDTAKWDDAEYPIPVS